MRHELDVSVIKGIGFQSNHKDSENILKLIPWEMEIKGTWG